MREIRERIVDQCMQRFGGVALVPVGHTQPVADLRRVVLAEHESARADDRLVAQRDQVRRFGPFVRVRNELFGIRQLVRMRNARGVFCDAAIVGDRCYRFSVLEAPCTQGKALGLEDGDTGFTVSSSRYFFQQGHGTGSRLKKLRGGAGHPSPPLRALTRPRRFDWMTGGPRVCPPSYSAAASVIGTTDT